MRIVNGVATAKLSNSGVHPFQSKSTSSDSGVSNIVTVDFGNLNREAHIAIKLVEQFCATLWKKNATSGDVVRDVVQGSYRDIALRVG